MASDITKAGRILAQQLSGETYGMASPTVCSVLNRLAKRHCRMMERECNEPMTDEQKKRFDAAEKRLCERITKVAKELEIVCGVHFSGDPRGYTVKLMRKDDKYNTWGGASEGWGIGD